MDRLDSLRVFIAVAESNGFAPAARSLGFSPPAVTRAVAAVERRIGAQLLQRSTRTVRLTEAGQAFYDDCKRILAELDDAESAAGGRHAVPSGWIAITAPTMFGRLHVTPLLIDFLALYPDVSARSYYADRIVPLLDEGYDVAVRFAHLPDSGLTAVRVGSMRRVVAASPAYLAERGAPLSPAELAGHDAIGFSSSGAAHVSPWFAGPPPRVRLLVNAGEAGIAAALRGRGLVRAFWYQVVDDVQAGRLQIVLADHEPEPLPVSVVYAAGRRASAKVRVFVDFIVQRLREDPALLAAGQR
jgi:DNA-binding transcriptional LysR family regulator